MNITYGASYNCFIGSDPSIDPYEYALGGAEFSNDSDVDNNRIDYIGADLDRMEQYIINECEKDNDWEADRFYADRDQLEMIGGETDLGGKVVSVIYYIDDEGMQVVAAIFENPYIPKVI